MSDAYEQDPTREALDGERYRDMERSGPLQFGDTIRRIVELERQVKYLLRRVEEMAPQGHHALWCKFCGGARRKR